MVGAQAAVTRIDAGGMRDALLAGIAHVQFRRDYLNRINVFPVPDGDTGTNLLFTLASVRRAMVAIRPGRMGALLRTISDAALDGARGNSGAILAQYFHGISESCRDCRDLDAPVLARVTADGARAAWGAMSEPVAGTLPTVLEDFGAELAERVAEGCSDLRTLLRRGLERARKSLANTPNQLAVLREAGVVDAGAQGFVDLLEGMWGYVRDGRIPEPEADHIARPAPQLPVAGVGEYRFCTECMIRGTDLDMAGLRAGLEALEADSLVVAGGGQRARVHLHTNRPGEAFRVCAAFGDLYQQKADDMSRQHGLLNQRGLVAVVTDSAADLPADEIDRLGIHVIPVRLSFGAEEFLDKVSITPGAFYRRLVDSAIHPQTSQPPPADFRRQYELLAGHGHQVLSLHVSGRLSGTLQAAESAAGRVEGAIIRVFDTCNAACGQALLVLDAAESAARGDDLEAIEKRLATLAPRTRTFALSRDLTWGVRGGRVRPWMEWLARCLHLNPVLANTPDGRLTARGVIPGRRQAVARFGRYLLRRMDPGHAYRIVISHTDAAADAGALRDRLLAGHPEVDACWVVEASPAVGVHVGPRALIAGIQPRGLNDG